MCRLCCAGLNIRYLGYVARMTVAAMTEGMMSACVLEVIEMEMIARSLRRIVREHLQSHPELRNCAAPYYAKVLSCLLGAPEGHATASTTAAPAAGTLGTHLAHTPQTRSAEGCRA